MGLESPNWAVSGLSVAHKCYPQRLCFKTHSRVAYICDPSTMAVEHIPRLPQLLHCTEPKNNGMLPPPQSYGKGSTVVVPAVVVIVSLLLYLKQHIEFAHELDLEIKPPIAELDVAQLTSFTVRSPQRSSRRYLLDFFNFL